MSKIYKLWMAKFTEAWHQLSQEEKDSLWAKHNAIAEEFGVKTLVVCDSSWSSERWQGFGVEEYPDVEAAQKCTQALNEIEWMRYLDGSVILGTAMPQS